MIGMIGELVGTTVGKYVVTGIGGLALVGGIMTAYDSGAHTSEGVQKVTLNTVELVPGQYCDAIIGGDIESSSTYHFPVPILGGLNGILGKKIVPDLYNRTWSMSGGLEARVCTQSKALEAIPDADGNYDVTIDVGPDLETSDVELIVYPSPKNALTYKSRGNLVDSSMQSALNDVKAVAQAGGQTISTFADTLDGQLQGNAYSIGVSAFASQCGTTGVERLNQEDQITANLNTDPNAPHTMQEDIAVQAAKQTSGTAHPIDIGKVKVTYRFIGKGVANNYTANAIDRQKVAEAHKISIPDPSKLPTCKIETGK